MRKWTVAAVAATATLAYAGTAQARDETPKPYLGWSSWSLQASTYPGLNTLGSYSWLTEDKVVLPRAMASKLKSHGYEYINIDAGWWMDWSWNEHYDAYGRPRAWTASASRTA